MPHGNSTQKNNAVGLQCLGIRGAAPLCAPYKNTSSRDGTSSATLRHLTAMRNIDVLPRDGAVAVLLHEQFVLLSYLSPNTATQLMHGVAGKH